MCCDADNAFASLLAALASLSIITINGSASLHDTPADYASQACSRCLTPLSAAAEQGDAGLVAAGADAASTALRHSLHLADTPLLATIHHPGAITARLLAAGPAFLLPDLIQNMCDRPLEEVADLFTALAALPRRPSPEALASVFGWYDDGFLGGLPYERDPVAAWAECASVLLPAYTSRNGLL
jgi:hypothetical protein